MSCGWREGTNTWHLNKHYKQKCNKIKTPKDDFPAMSKLARPHSISMTCQCLHHSHQRCGNSAGAIMGWTRGYYHYLVLGDTSAREPLHDLVPCGHWPDHDLGNVHPTFGARHRHPNHTHSACDSVNITQRRCRCRRQQAQHPPWRFHQNFRVFPSFI
jgi:hypothetical protein